MALTIDEHCKHSLLIRQFVIFLYEQWYSMVPVLFTWPADQVDATFVRFIKCEKLLTFRSCAIVERLCD